MKRSIKEIEIRNRIFISIYAYAYEIENDSLVSDEEYDKLSYSIKFNLTTNNRKMDNFFKKNFDPFTSQWVHNHPELSKIGHIYNKYYKI